MCCWKNNELGHWILGDGLADPAWPWIYKYSLRVCRYKNICTKWRWATRSCSPVSPRYNIPIFMCCYMVMRIRICMQIAHHSSIHCSCNAPYNTTGNLHYFSCNNIISSIMTVIKYMSAWVIAYGYLWIKSITGKINKSIVFGYILPLHMHILAACVAH